MHRVIHTFAPIAFGFTAFIVAVVLGTVVTMGTGIPLLGGLVNGVFVAMILTIGMLAVNRFWTATIMWFVLGFAAIPTTTLGPAGVHKVVIALAAGIVWDTVYCVFRRNKLGLYLGAIAGAGAIMGLMMLALYLGFGDNAGEAFEKYAKAIYILLAINFTVTGVGVFLGHQVYWTRLARIEVFRNLRTPTEGS